MATMAKARKPAAMAALTTGGMIRLLLASGKPLHHAPAASPDLTLTRTVAELLSGFGSVVSLVTVAVSVSAVTPGFGLTTSSTVARDPSAIEPSLQVTAVDPEGGRSTIPGSPGR
jgi:hypothetical protein